MNPPNMTTVTDYDHWTAVEGSSYHQSAWAMWLRISHTSPQAVNLVRDSRGDDELSTFIQKKHFLLTLHFLLSFPGHTCTSCGQAARSRETRTAMNIQYRISLVLKPMVKGLRLSVTLCGPISFSALVPLKRVEQWLHLCTYVNTFPHPVVSSNHSWESSLSGPNDISARMWISHSCHAHMRTHTYTHTQKWGGI